MPLSQRQDKKAHYFSPLMEYRTESWLAKCQIINQHQPSAMSRTRLLFSQVLRPINTRHSIPENENKCTEGKSLKLLKQTLKDYKVIDFTGNHFWFWVSF